MESASELATPVAAGERPASALVLRGLRRAFGDRLVLRDVSIEISPRTTLAVLGPNGAGKSTLLRILATLLRPTAGEVEVLGASLPRQAWKVRGRIGYLGHEPLLYRELTVRENLAFNAGLHRIGDPDARIAGLLDASGLSRRADELVRNLSAGMLQRAAVCRALVHDPELLLLDEPGSHLDVDAAREVDAMLGPATKRTRVVVTHDIDRGLAEADSVLVLGPGGRVALAGPTADVLGSDVRAAYGGPA